MDIPSLNILPPDLSVNQARILSPTEKEENKWVDLMMLTENTSFMNIKAKLEGNLIKGHRSTVLHGQEAVEYQKKETTRTRQYRSRPDNRNYPERQANRHQPKKWNIRKTIRVR